MIPRERFPQWIQFSVLPFIFGWEESQNVSEVWFISVKGTQKKRNGQQEENNKQRSQSNLFAKSKYHSKISHFQTVSNHCQSILTI